VIVAVFCVLVASQHVLANRFLFRWAQGQGLRITSYEKRYTRAGPFVGHHWQGQFVYKICAVNTLGETRNGWVRVGHWLAGVLSSDIQVIWDTPQSPQSVA
jgi:hypothetical protein